MAGPCRVGWGAGICGWYAPEDLPSVLGMVTTTQHALAEDAPTGAPDTGVSPQDNDLEPLPVPLDQVPEVCAALERIGIPPFVEGMLEARPGRNDNWSGAIADGREIFVKQISGARDSALRRFDRERACHTFLAASGTTGIRTPALLGADKEALVLVHERLRHAVSGSRLSQRREFDTQMAAAAGRMVGTLHAQPLDAVPAGIRTDTARGALRGWRPSGLSCLDLSRYVAGSAGELGVWELLQHDRRVRAAMDDLSASTAMAAQAPGHGDLRLDQFLYADGEMHLTDWEEFGPLDPACDVGNFAGEWLYRAARRMFTEVDPDGAGVSGDAHSAFVRSGDQELESVRPLIAAFWRGYRAVRGAAADRALAERAVAFAGWHLFDRVFATAVHASRITEVDRGVAGVGRGALLTPASFVTVLGLADDGDLRDEYSEQNREYV